VTVKDDLIAAKQELVTRGRTRKVPVNRGTGCVCIIGAVGVAIDPDKALRDPLASYLIVSNTDRGRDAANALTIAYDVSKYYDNYQLWRIGDNEDISDEQLYDLFDKAIESAE
jgi:hypothetical protein